MRRIIVPAEKPLPPVNVKAASMKQGSTTLDNLAATAKREGSLTVIGLPRDWVNYGAIIDTFTDKYGIKVNELEPGASSRREIEAAAQLKPDVFDLTLDVAVADAAEFAPYKVQGWQDLPDHIEEPGGAWYGAYGGYMSIGYDPRKVPPPPPSPTWRPSRATWSRSTATAPGGGLRRRDGRLAGLGRAAAAARRRAVRQAQAAGLTDPARPTCSSTGTHSRRPQRPRRGGVEGDDPR